MSLATTVADPELDRASATRTAQSYKNVRPSLVAVDLGAESCRVSLLTWHKGQPSIQLVHRFANAPIKDGNNLRWDLRRICDGVEEGLRACAELASEGITAIGVDGWAVDYVRLDANGRPLSDPFCYRDQRTLAAQSEVLARISAEDLYEFTGIQFLPLNTLYQLYADGSQDISASAPWVTLPEFVLYTLGADRVSEYTNATHTQMLRIDTRAWCREIFDAANFDMNAAPPVVYPGTAVGKLQGPLVSLPALRNAKLIAPACHDTASAVAGIPAQGNDWAFISSGTWSLVGCVLDSPCLSKQARQSNFSNEGGIGGRINFLKNVNGMWLLQQCIQHWATEGTTWTWEELVDKCSLLPAPTFSLDVDDPDLLLPGDMPARINSQLARMGIAPIEEAPAMANLIMHSLAARYATVLRDLVSVTGRDLKHVYIVGGANKNTLLNRLTEQATGLKVVVGPVESATVGNFAIQLASLSGQYTRLVGVNAGAVADWAAQIARSSPASGIEVCA